MNEWNMLRAESSPVLYQSLACIGLVEVSIYLTSTILINYFGE